jgi:hypothetical protein
MTWLLWGRLLLLVAVVATVALMIWAAERGRPS